MCRVYHTVQKSAFQSMTRFLKDDKCPAFFYFLLFRARPPRLRAAELRGAVVKRTFAPWACFKRGCGDSRRGTRETPRPQGPGAHGAGRRWRLQANTSPRPLLLPESLNASSAATASVKCRDSSRWVRDRWLAARSCPARACLQRSPPAPRRRGAERRL